MKNGSLSFQVISLVFALTASTLSWAGNADSGGGDAIICKSGAPVLRTIFGWKKVYLADTFFFLRDGGENLLPLLNEQQTLDSALQTIDENEPGLGTEIKATIDSLTFVEVQDVEELDDDNIVLNLPGCHKKQLAIQDLVEKRVRVNSGLYAKLSPAERALFKIHEAYIHIRNAPRDTTPVRAEVRSIIESPNFDSFVRKTVPKYSKLDILRKTKAMLKIECNLNEEPVSTDRFSRIGCGRLRALEVSIEAGTFVNLHVDVVGSDLADIDDHGTVADLRDYIWNAIPEIFKKDQ